MRGLLTLVTIAVAAVIVVAAGPSLFPAAKCAPVSAPAGAVAWLDVNVSLERMGEEWVATITADDKPIDMYQPHCTTTMTDKVFEAGGEQGEWRFAGAITVTQSDPHSELSRLILDGIVLRHGQSSSGRVYFEPPTAFFIVRANYEIQVQATIRLHSPTGAQWDMDSAAAQQFGYAAGF